MMQTPPPAPGKYPGYWKIKKARRWLRNHLSAWLARGAQAPVAFTPLDPAQIRRVMVCRRNNRLGNMLFLTPLLRSLAATLPQAEIDVLIGSASYVGLFQGLPGVRQVWVVPQRSWLWPLRMLSMLRRLRAQHYDLVIEPSLNSFSNRLSARLCGARWRLGFHSPDQWLSLTHAIPRKVGERHQVLKPLQLLSRGFAGPVQLYPQLAIALDAQERATGRARLMNALCSTGNGPVIGFFTEATGKKRLPPDWWLDWLAGLRQSGANFRLLQILPPGTTSALDPALPHLREPDHRALAAILGTLDLFVSCDAGPMHLASAAGAPTIGLFHTTDSNRYRPLGERSLGLDINDMTPAQTAAVVLRHLSQLTG